MKKKASNGFPDAPVAPSACTGGVFQNLLLATWATVMFEKFQRFYVNPFMLNTADLNHFDQGKLANF